jgi:hypothetical protein
VLLLSTAALVGCLFVGPVFLMFAWMPSPTWAFWAPIALFLSAALLTPFGWVWFRQRRYRKAALSEVPGVILGMIVLVLFS